MTFSCNPTVEQWICSASIFQKYSCQPESKVTHGLDTKKLVTLKKKIREWDGLTGICNMWFMQSSMVLAHSCEIFPKQLTRESCYLGWSHEKVSKVVQNSLFVHFSSAIQISQEPKFCIDFPCIHHLVMVQHWNQKMFAIHVFVLAASSALESFWTRNQKEKCCLASINSWFWQCPSRTP